MFYQRLHRKLYEFEDVRGVIRSRKSKKKKKDRQHNCQKKRTKGQTTIYKTLHRRLMIEHHMIRFNEAKLQGQRVKTYITIPTMTYISIVYIFSYLIDKTRFTINFQ